MSRAASSSESANATYTQNVQATNEEDDWMRVEDLSPIAEPLPTEQVMANLADGPQQSASPAAEMYRIGTPDSYSSEVESHDPEPHVPVHVAEPIGIAEPMPPRMVNTPASRPFQLAQGKGNVKGSKDGRGHEPSDDQHLEGQGSLKGKGSLNGKGKDKGKGKGKAKGKKGKNGEDDQGREEDPLNMTEQVSFAAAPAARKRRAQNENDAMVERMREIDAMVAEADRVEAILDHVVPPLPRHDEPRRAAEPAAPQHPAQEQAAAAAAAAPAAPPVAPAPAAPPANEEWTFGQIAGCALATAASVGGGIWVGTKLTEMFDKGKRDQDDSVKVKPPQSKSQPSACASCASFSSSVTSFFPTASDTASNKSASSSKKSSSRSVTSISSSVESFYPAASETASNKSASSSKKSSSRSVTSISSNVENFYPAASDTASNKSARSVTSISSSVESFYPAASETASNKSASSSKSSGASSKKSASSSNKSSSRSVASTAASETASNNRMSCKSSTSASKKSSSRSTAW